MRIFITGTNGQLGYDVAKECLNRGYETIGCGTTAFSNNELDIDYVQLDLTNRQDVISVITNLHPDVIVHCAAWTDVNAAEIIDNYDKVYEINVKATTWLADIAHSIDAKIVYISTDYVFDGTGKKAWTPENIGNPLNVYGSTKLRGEIFLSLLTPKHFIIRTSWVFGKNGKNFIKTMLTLSEKYDILNIVNDQIGRPTYTADLAQLICDMIITNKYGIYHATNSGEFISWSDFAKEIFKQTNKNIKINPVTSEMYGNNVKRPKNSRLDISKLEINGFNLLPDWKDALRRYLNENN